MRRSYLQAVVLGLLFVSGSGAQYPAMDAVANKVIQKFQQTSCEDLAAKKGAPKPPQEQKIIEMLRSDPARRTAFIDKVAGPIANKLFDCGMIP